MKRNTLALISAASLSFGLAAPASAFACSQPADAPPAAQPVAPDTLDKLLAPIALYPDALVLQVLECAVNPNEVKRLAGWMKKNPDLKGTAAQDAALAEGFAASYVAIVMFPQVVTMMSDQPDWTANVGKAFTGDRPGVFASIQRLRTQAQSMGNLKTSEQQTVESVTTTSGQQVIVIQPANPEIVYVPVYSPTVVYTQPPPPPSSGNTAAAGLIGFTTGIIIGAAIADNNNNYCWGYHGGLSNDDYEDYADHRENMAEQRGDNQSNRQSSSTEKQANRQSASSANQAQRQEAAGSGQSASSQSVSGKTAAARGTTQGASAQSQSGTKSGAMSGYKSGTAEREASARGRSSTSQTSAPAARPAGRSSGGSRGGGRSR